MPPACSQNLDKELIKLKQDRGQDQSIISLSHAHIHLSNFESDFGSVSLGELDMRIAGLDELL
jgi:hypothetical protein